MKNVSNLLKLDIFDISSQYGIEKTRDFTENLFSILNELSNTFGDGFQVTDLFALTSIISDLTSMLKNFESVKKELSDLQIKEITELVIYISDELERLLNLEGPDTGTQGVKKIAEFLKGLYDLIVEAHEALKDGVQLDDFKYAGPVLMKVINLVQLAPDAFNEITDIKKAEFKNVFIMFYLQIIDYIKHFEK